jgi:hypothetical protein
VSARSAKNLILIVSTGHKEAFSRYRVFSCFIWQNVAIDEQYTSRRDAMITETVDYVTHAFKPWANPDADASMQVSNLAGIFRCAADLGLLLYRQPSVYYFNWRMSESHRSLAQLQIVVSPNMLKIENELGQALEEPQTMVEMKPAMLQVVSKCSAAPPMNTIKQDQSRSYQPYSKEAETALYQRSMSVEAPNIQDTTTAGVHGAELEDRNSHGTEATLVKRRALPSELSGAENSERGRGKPSAHEGVHEMGTLDIAPLQLESRHDRSQREVFELPAEIVQGRSHSSGELQARYYVRGNRSTVIHGDSRALTFPPGTDRNVRGATEYR